MDWGVFIAAIGAVSAILLGWLGFTRSVKNSIRDDASAGASMKQDMEYIKRGVEDIRLEQKDQGRRFDALAERVTRVEENSRSAHRRIDRLEGGRQ